MKPKESYTSSAPGWRRGLLTVRGAELLARADVVVY
jgi:siroheme synthase